MLKPMTEREIESIAREAVSDSVDFVESEIAEDRIKAQRYFDGEVDIGEEEGRSKVVATKVRDTIRAIKPSLMRVFLSTDKPVEYVPRGPEDVQAAEQATEYMHYVFNEHNGYRVLNDAFHDAMVKKVGIVKVYWDNYQEQETYDFENLNEMEYRVITMDDDVEVLESVTRTVIEVDDMGLDTEATVYDLKIARYKDVGKMCIESVPPEEFFVDRNARSLDDAYAVCHRTEMRIGDLIGMGYDYEDVKDLTGLQHADTFSEVEEFERRGYEEDYSDEDIKDPAMRLVAVTEVYMKVDVSGSGIPTLQKITLGGAQHKLLDYMACSHIPFAAFEVDPEPHTFYGRSVADLIINEQDASTAMLRGVLDNVALTNNPRMEILDGAVNIDDLLNNEIGGVIRVKQPNAIVPQAIPFVAGQTLAALQYMDQEIEDKTGVTRASTGLSPDALQNTTAAAVQATVQAQAGQIEVMARNLAEGGMRQMFTLMLKVMHENVEEQQMMRIAGADYVPVDPRSWNVTMDVTVNVGLGTGQEEQKLAALMQAFQVQQQILGQYGPQNGIVTLTQVRNTLADMLALNGIRNSTRYFNPMNPETEQQLIQQQEQASQQQGQQGDPQAQAFLQAEQMKAQAKAQTDMAKLQAQAQKDQFKLQLEAQKAAADDDRERDKMDQDLLVSAAEILGKYGTAVDVERIKQMQAVPR
ncbi:MAG: putative portal protein [Prokaryotic dsDNA virus sp.]|nr:MAG: putative portal protein [Prokaryotic dsDNA virus sp.]|tara:strand:+ start:26648 stop:28735 length:2088 start_codon:yes stop_codon:yes gene_type:complete